MDRLDPPPFLTELVRTQTHRQIDCHYARWATRHITEHRHRAKYQKPLL